MKVDYKPYGLYIQFSDERPIVTITELVELIHQEDGTLCAMRLWLREVEASFRTRA